jgi:hypothetical protein
MRSRLSFGGEIQIRGGNRVPFCVFCRYGMFRQKTLKSARNHVRDAFIQPVYN